MARNPENKYSGGQSARLLNISSVRSLEVLDLLHKNRMANREKVGKARQQSLNKKTFLVIEISSLINMEKRVYKEVGMILI